VCAPSAAHPRPCDAERHELSTAILIPVLDRPHRIKPLLANIADATTEPHRVVFAASDQPTVDELERHGAAFLRDDGDTWPNRINRLFHATEAPYVFLGADDVLFQRGWLAAALSTMRRVEGVVVVNDLHNANGTNALVSRRYIEEQSGCVDVPGVVIYPGYDHNYSDSECWEVARSRGKLMRADGAIVEHQHPAAGKGEMDATYRKGHATMEADRALYRSRRHLWTSPSTSR